VFLIFCHTPTLLSGILPLLLKNWKIICALVSTFNANWFDPDSSNHTIQTNVIQIEHPLHCCKNWNSFNLKWLKPWSYFVKGRHLGGTHSRTWLADRSGVRGWRLDDRTTTITAMCRFFSYYLLSVARQWTWLWGHWGVESLTMSSHFYFTFSKTTKFFMLFSNWPIHP
jgi:hypothetical protein